MAITNVSKALSGSSAVLPAECLPGTCPHTKYCSRQESLCESYLNCTETHTFPGRDTAPCPQRGNSCVLSQSLPNRKMEGLPHCTPGFPAVPRSTIGISKALAPCWQRPWPSVAAVSSPCMFPYIGEALLLPAWLCYPGQSRDSLLSLRAQSALSNWGGYPPTWTAHVFLLNQRTEPESSRNALPAQTKMQMSTGDSRAIYK